MPESTKVDFKSSLKSRYFLLKKTLFFLVKNKSLIVFPLCFATFSLLCVLTMIVLSTFIVMSCDINSFDIITFIGSNIYYFLFLIILLFLIPFFHGICKVAFFSEVLGRFYGNRISILHGFYVGFRLLKNVFYWESINFTVGIIVGLMGSITGSKYINHISFGIADISWKLASFFVFPVMVYEKRVKNPFEILRYSTRILKTTFGLSATLFLGFKIFAIAVGLVWFGLVLSMIYIYSVSNSNEIFVLTSSLIVFSSLILFLSLVLLTTAQEIYKAGIFMYATKQKINFLYDEADITNAFIEK